MYLGLPNKSSGEEFDSFLELLQVSSVSHCRVQCHCVGIL